MKKKMAFRAGHAVCCSFKIYLILSVLLLPAVSNRIKIKISCSFVSRGENIVETIVGNIVEAENIASRLTCLVGHLGCGKSKKRSFFKSKISRYGSYENCITFQLLKDSCLMRIMLSGDVHCNPGPDNSRCLGHDCAVLSRSKSTRGQSSNGVGKVIPVRVTSGRPTKLCMTQQRNQRNLAKLKFNRSYNMPPFSFHTINARSVKNKVAELRHYITDNRVDLLVITESWLSSNDNVVVNRLIPDGYKFIHQPREKRKGGGLAVLHRNGIDVKIKRQGITKSLEYNDSYVTCENRSFELIAIYRPGKNPKDGKDVPIYTFFGDFMEILDSHDTATYDLVIAGDLNFHVNDDNSIQ